MSQETRQPFGLKRGMAAASSSLFDLPNLPAVGESKSLRVEITEEDADGGLSDLEYLFLEICSSMASNSQFAVTPCFRYLPSKSEP